MRHWLVIVVLLSELQTVIGCGCCRPCHSFRPHCPPPIICPPQICPPPIPCPPSLPSICPPPSSCSTPPLFTQNICCVTCIIPCMMRARKRRDVSAQNFTAALNTIVDDATCNNLKLKSVMDENMSEKDPKMAMMKVRKAIEKKLPGKYSVICANGDFSYTAYTDSFCQTRNDPLTCYAFKPLMLEASLVSRA